ncbi:MAG: metallophosphatase family protein [Candidatus Omnitrophica bacterium]|nr:metallophosphatase family protein [Candidatus Omnitrophota bacterium]
MKYAIISDIHNNFEALTNVLSACRLHRVEQIYCAGDIVGYAANPIECLQLVRETNIMCVAGNHDWAVCGRLDAMYFNEWGKVGIEYTRNNLSLSDFEFLANLELSYANPDLVIVHGTLNQPEAFQYLDDITKVPDTCSLMKAPVCFVGHTHEPKIYIKKGNNIYYSDVLDVEMKDDAQYIINVGSVGQPRDGNPLASFCVYDSVDRSVTIHRIPYDIQAAQEKIIAAGLPEYVAHRLSLGQ